MITAAKKILSAFFIVGHLCKFCKRKLRLDVALANKIFVFLNGSLLTGFAAAPKC